MKIVSFGLTDGAGFWRTRIPFGALNEHGHHCYLSSNAINDEELEKADVVVLKNVVDQMGIASALAMREINKTKIVMDIDDDLLVNDDHVMKKRHDQAESFFTQTQTAKAVDAITTTTEYLANKLRKLNPNVFVCPNFYEPNWFNVKNRANSGPLRIGWTGGVNHVGDLAMITPAIKRLKEKYGVKVVTRGDPRIKELWGKDVESFPPVPIKYYPEALASMAIDIGICPLEDNEFNKCKSEIKFMEYSLLGIPSVCSPTVYEHVPVSTVARTEDEWVEKLSKLIESEQLRRNQGTVAKAWVQENKNINNNWKVWEAAYG